MVLLYRERECPRCDIIEERLGNLCLARKVLFLDEACGKNKFPAEEKAPVLTFGEEEVKGDANILKYLDYLESYKGKWDRYQADACYCDDGQD